MTMTITMTPEELGFEEGADETGLEMARYLDENK